MSYRPEFESQRIPITALGQEPDLVSWPDPGNGMEYPGVDTGMGVSGDSSAWGGPLFRACGVLPNGRRHPSFRLLEAVEDSTVLQA